MTSLFMPCNQHNDVQVIMEALELFGLAAGLKVNFRKSKLLPLCSCDWHSLLWPGEFVPPNVITRHLGYPIGWNVTHKQKVDSVMYRLNTKLHYWKLSTWPLHVSLRIVQSILMAYVQFFLPLLHWPRHCLDSLMSTILTHLWRTHAHKKGLRLMSMAKLCTLRRFGGLNILDLRRQVLARKAILLPTLMQLSQPWTLMFAYLSQHVVTSSFGHWQSSI
ncbi:hypothetical protein L7F22_057446 [Adiantum nelumboides]|nr:hypothetical protein [Adiantum nelumboides]